MAGFMSLGDREASRQNGGHPSGATHLCSLAFLWNNEATGLVVLIAPSNNHGPPADSRCRRETLGHAAQTALMTAIHTVAPAHARFGADHAAPGDKRQIPAGGTKWAAAVFRFGSERVRPS